MNTHVRYTEGRKDEIHLFFQTNKAINDNISFDLSKFGTKKSNFPVAKMYLHIQVHVFQG